MKADLKSLWDQTYPDSKATLRLVKVGAIVKSLTLLLMSRTNLIYNDLHVPIVQYFASSRTNPLVLSLKPIPNPQVVQSLSHSHIPGYPIIIRRTLVSKLLEIDIVFLFFTYYRCSQNEWFFLLYNVSALIPCPT